MTDDEVHALNRDAQSELREAFEAFDLNGDGMLDAHELRGLLHAVGQPASLRESHKLIASVDREGLGRLDLRGFVELVEPIPTGLDAEADIAEAFRLLDTDGDGYLSPYELRRDGLEAEEAAQIVRLADADGDGRLSFDEFRAAMRLAG